MIGSRILLGAIAYNICLALILYVLYARSNDRFTGTQGMELCRRIQALEEVYGRTEACPAFRNIGEGENR